MTERQTHEHVLDGCQPTPLARYLKALGILRLVAEQVDPGARGHWHRDRFVLRTTLDREGLEGFFLEAYQPTPIVGPWGARSGFYPESSEKAAREALEEIERCSDDRLKPFVATIREVRAILADLQISSKKLVEEKKHALMESCRARLPDSGLPWLDACFTLLADDERFPPILGTGGNEGSGSYMSGFAQQVTACVVHRKHDAMVPGALWDTSAPQMVVDQTPGHFLPHAGGANAATGFSDDPSINAWEYLLLLEGALLFASAASRRADVAPASRRASTPFTVESAPAGYATALPEKNRGELWLPVWHSPISLPELKALFGEGRANVGKRVARNGVDFARAAASLGVDRGIARFERYGIQERNGQNNIAVLLGRFEVREQRGANLLGDIDAWLEAFRRNASNDKAPASAHRALRQLETAILEFCQRGDALRAQQVVIALGRCERVMASSQRWTEEAYLQPVPPLSPRWLQGIDDGSTELRLAACLASVWGYYSDDQGRRSAMPLRRQLEPITTWRHNQHLRARWDFDADRDVVWSSGHLGEVLNSALQRRLVRAVQQGDEGYADRGLETAPGDIADFIEGRVDDAQLTDLLWGCALLDWTRVRREHRPAPRKPRHEPWPGAFYALLKLCFPGSTWRPSEDDLSASAQERDTPEGTTKSAGHRDRPGTHVPIDLRIHRLAATGQGAAASQQAVRRLRGSGLGPALGGVQVRGEIACRSAAALLFPLSAGDLARLATMVLRPDQVTEEDRQPNSPNSQGATT